MDLNRGALDLSSGKQYPLDGSEIPFVSVDDARALLPGYAQQGDDSQMRLAVLTMVVAVANYVWAKSGIALNALVSPRYAAGGMLDIWGDVIQMRRANGEDDGSYRARELSPPASRTPNAIRSAVTALVQSVSGTTPVFQEPASDGFFLGDDSGAPLSWGCFTQPDNGFLWGYDPLAPNPTWGTYLVDPPWSQFWVVLQLGAADNGSSGYTPSETSGVYTDPNDFLADDTGAGGGCYLSGDGDPLDIRTVSLVEALRAFGVPWILIEESNLTGAK